MEADLTEIAIGVGFAVTAVAIVAGGVTSVGAGLEQRQTDRHVGVCAHEAFKGTARRLPDEYCTDGVPRLGGTFDAAWQWLPESLHAEVPPVGYRFTVGFENPPTSAPARVGMPVDGGAFGQAWDAATAKEVTP